MARLLVTIVMMVCLVTMTQADSAPDCTATCKGCIDVSESFKRVQCKITCEAFSGANPFGCGNVNPVPPAVLKQELETFERKFLDHFTADERTELISMFDASYKLVPVGIDPVFGKDDALEFYIDWRTLNAEDEKSESVVIENCGENDGYVWMHGIQYGYSLPDQKGTKVERFRAQRLMKRAADRSLKIVLDVIA